MMFCFQGKRRPLLGAALAVFLTLYPVNKSSAQSDWEPSTNVGFQIDALFDFEVPITVVETGVEWGVTSAFTNIPDDFLDSLDSVYEGAGWSDGWENADWGISTNGFSRLGSSGAFATVDPFFTNGLSSVVVGSAVSPRQDLIGGGSSVGVLPSVGLDSLDGVWSSYLSSDSPSEPFVVDNPVISGFLPSGFWVTSLSKSDLQNFDGGSLNAWIHTISADGLLGWLPDAWDGTCTNFVEMVNSRVPTGLRKYVQLACVLLYWVSLYRLLLKRLVLCVQACFSGV